MNSSTWTEDEFDEFDAFDLWVHVSVGPDPGPGPGPRPLAVDGPEQFLIF
jgi:hypothetical protein